MNEMRIAAGSTDGLIEALVAANGVRGMRAATPLPKDTQELFDRVTVKVGMERLSGMQRLLQLGLTRPEPDWLSVMELYWEKVARHGTAIRTMDPGSGGERSLPSYTGSRIPLYATRRAFPLSSRVLAAARRTGSPVETDMVEEAVRACNESFEDALLNGADYIVGGNSVPGFLNHPNVSTFTYTDNEAWDAAGHSGADILADVQAGIATLRANNFYGPYEGLVPTAYGAKLNDDFKAESDLTIKQRLQLLEYGGRNLVITTCDLLPTNRTVIFQATSNVVDVIVGQQPVPVSWVSADGYTSNHAVIGCMVPRVKDDANGNMGVAVGNLT